MRTYLVGGAVRDALLKRIPHEKDWVVIGATIEDMINQGFKPVGQEFPVFLHPKTHEEYALARTERKVAQGYKGFTFYTSPDVTLEQDLARRDLTINAMAQDDQGHIVDPFHGQADLKNKILRHVSEAFAEDPVRILRVARFAAQLEDFEIAPQTLTLMQKMVKNGEINALIPERIWQEFQRSLEAPLPHRFFEVLKECHALPILFPELDALFGVPNPARWHPEVDSGIHTLLTLQRAAELTPDPLVRFAALTHDFGKAKTPPQAWPKHTAHCQRGTLCVKTLCQRIRVPKEYQELAILVACYHGQCHQAFKLTETTLLQLLKALDPFRRHARFERFLLACQADIQGRQGTKNKAYPQKDFLKKIYEICAAIDTSALVKQFKTGEALARAIQTARLTAIQQFLENHHDDFKQNL